MPVQAGRPIRVNVHFDPEVKSFWANSPDLDGLVVTGATRDELQQEARAAAGELLELSGVHVKPQLQFADVE